MNNSFTLDRRDEILSRILDIILALYDETASPDDLGRTTGEAADASETFAPDLFNNTTIDEIPTARL